MIVGIWSWKTVLYYLIEKHRGRTLFLCHLPWILQVLYLPQNRGLGSKNQKVLQEPYSVLSISLRCFLTDLNVMVYELSLWCFINIYIPIHIYLVVTNEVVHLDPALDILFMPLVIFTHTVLCSDASVQWKHFCLAVIHCVMDCQANNGIVTVAYIHITTWCLCLHVEVKVPLYIHQQHSLLCNWPKKLFRKVSNAVCW